MNGPAVRPHHGDDEWKYFGCSGLSKIDSANFQWCFVGRHLHCYSSCWTGLGQIGFEHDQLPEAAMKPCRDACQLVKQKSITIIKLSAR